MVFAKERIEIETVIVDNVTGAARRINKSIQEIGHGVTKTREEVEGWNSAGKSVSKTTDTMTRGQHRFKMELLGVMFAGMALSRVMTGLLRPAAEAFGIFELWGAMLTVVFLPIMSAITPILMVFLDFFMNLPEGVQLAIGAVVLFLAALGAFLFIFGQIGLAWTSIVTAFPMLLPILAKIGIAVKALWATFGTLIVWIGGVALIVVGVYQIVKGKLEGIGTIIMGIGIILLLFIGWWALIPIAVGAAVYFIIKHWETVKQWFVSFWNWLKNAAKVAWDFIKKMFEFTPLGIIMGMGSKVLGAFHSGGVVPQSGAYLLQRGETVTPAGAGINTSIAPSITVNANVSSDYDVRRLAEELKRYWVTDFERISQGRSI